MWSLPRFGGACGNDAVVVAPAFRDELDSPLVFVPFLSEQTEWHTQLPQRLPSLKSGVQPLLLTRGVLLSQTFATGYYHVLVDLLPRMVLAKDLVPTDVIWIIQSDHGGIMKPYVTQLLALLGVMPWRVSNYEVKADASTDDAVRLAVDELTVIDWEWDDPNDEGNASPESLPPTALRHCPPGYVLQRTRDWALHAVGASLSARRRRRTVVFLSRRQAETRKLNDMQEQRLLRRIRGLLPTDWNAMVYSDRALPPMADTIRIFGSASVVVGVHGAGLSHLIFCQSGTQVVEIALPEPHALYFQHLSAELGLGYSKIPMHGSGLYGAPVLPTEAVDEDAVIGAVAAAVAAVDAEGETSSLLA